MLNWAEHHRFEGGPVRLGAHHRPRARRARRCDTSSMPAGEKISRLPVPSRCRRVTSTPPSPGATE